MITIVVGAPCAGKSTFCEEYAAPGDVVVDFDKLALALGSGSSHAAPRAVADVAFAARDAVIAKLLDGFVGDAWIIHTNPTADQVATYKAADARFVMVNPGIALCLERAKDRPDGTADTIRAWYESPPDVPIDVLDASEKSGVFLRPKRGAVMQTKTARVSVKAGPADGLEEGQFLVYPSTFTKTPDSYGDIVAKGAFLESLAAWKDSGNTIPALYGHRLDDPDFFVGGAIETGEDDHGWWVKGEFDLESPKGAQVYRLVKGRRLNQLSFAYDVIDEGQVVLENGTKANELRKLNIYEFSFVPVGANQDTSVVAVKSTTEALVADLKEGRVLASKHIDSLRKAQEAIGAAIAAASGTDEEKASGQVVAKSDASAEEPTQAKSPVSVEEPSVNPSARSLIAEMQLLALT